MARASCTFRQSDATRAVRGRYRGWSTVKQVEIDKDGKIVVVVGSADKAASEADSNAWDSELEK